MEATDCCVATRCPFVVPVPAELMESARRWLTKRGRDQCGLVDGVAFFRSSALADQFAESMGALLDAEAA